MKEKSEKRRKVRLTSKTISVVHPNLYVKKFVSIVWAFNVLPIIVTVNFGQYSYIYINKFTSILIKVIFSGPKSGQYGLSTSLNKVAGCKLLTGNSSSSIIIPSILGDFPGRYHLVQAKSVPGSVPTSSFSARSQLLAVFSYFQSHNWCIWCWCNSKFRIWLNFS